MKRWSLIVVGVGLLPALAVSAEFGWIEGRIRAEGGEPLPYANVVVKGTVLGAVSGPDGIYSLPRVPVGRYLVEASMMGYRAQVKEVEVHIGMVTTLDFELKESAIELGGVVVTATRTPRYIKDVPVRTEVITSKVIEEKGACNLYEALEGMPGIRVEQQCSYCNFSILRMQGLESGHVQVLIDGQPVFSGLAGVYGLQQIPAANIDRIEVVKGAGSALYGSSAIAGAINIITKQPTAKPMVEFSSSFGIHNTNDYTLAASTGARNMDVGLTVQKNTGDEIDEDGDGFTDRVRTDNVATGVRANWYEVLGGDRFTITGRTLNELRQGGELATFENPFAEAAEHIKTTRYEAEIGYRKKFLYGGEVGLNLAYTLHHRSATNDAFLSDYQATHDDTMPPVDEMAPYLAQEDLYVVDMNYFHPLMGRHRLLAGVQYSHNKLEETGRYVIVDETDSVGYGGTYTSESEKYADDVGAYLQGESSISDALELVAGARYDLHHSEDNFGGSGKVAPRERIELKYDETAFNPRFALKYSLSELTLRVSAGTGFRVPYGFSEDLHLCSGSPRVNKPAGLRPEKSVSFNLGIDWTQAGYLLNANIFRTNLKDKIGFADASDESKRLGYTYEWANIDNAYTQGIELGAQALLIKDLVLDLNLAYTDAQYEHEREDWVKNHPEYAAVSRYIPRVPRVTGGVKLSASPFDWDLVLDADYTGRMYIDYCQDEDITQSESKIVHTDPFWVVNSRVAKSLQGLGLTVFVGVKNLFDYVQAERHPDDAAFMYAPYTGRIIYGGFEVGF